MEVKVLFFGVLADVAGTSVRHYGDVGSTDRLMIRIQDDFPEFIHYNFRTSVNREIVNGDVLLNDGDEVAFMPPFAGG